MPIQTFRPPVIPDRSPRFEGKVEQFEQLLRALRQRSLRDEVARQINAEIDDLHTYQGDATDWAGRLGRTQQQVLKLVEKEQQLVSRHHYRRQWMLVGMTAIGIPLGAAFGSAFDNMSFLAIGMPIGMAIGIAIGTALDRKAEREGRQLDFEARY